MPEPFVLSLPVFECPPNMHGFTGRMIAMRMTPIPDARIGIPPSMCEVEGIHESGRIMSFILPIVEFRRVAANPATFVEVNDRRAETKYLVGQGEGQNV